MSTPIPSDVPVRMSASVAAMNKYRASYGAFPAHAPSAGAFTNAVQNMINSMEEDDAGADVFGPNPVD